MIRLSNVLKLLALIVVPISTALFAFYLIFLRMDFVPKEELIRQWLPEFTSQFKTVKGLYGNQDIDSLIFRVELTNEPHATMEQIKKMAQNNGWKIEEQKSDRFIRVTRFDDSKAFFSYEECRLNFIPETGKGYIGYLQADSLVRVRNISETSEASWANTELWPRFEKYLQKELTQI